VHVLVLNCGSSSLKYSIYDVDTGKRVHHGKVERIGDTVDGRLHTHQLAIKHALEDTRDYPFDAVGYRVVHGGTRYTAATEVDDDVLAEIEARIPDAPMHNPYALDAIKLARLQQPSIPHVAVFDTAFHATMPRRAKTYAIDAAVAERHGIQRFGFHGISHAYVASKAAGFLQRPLGDLRLITLHLGNGASVCAVEYGHSTETSMGNTPLEGLVMGSRAGDVDAGVLMSLLRTDEFDIDSLDDMLNNSSGLAGLSGISNDLRVIEDEAEQGNAHARLAINVFAHRARKYIGAYAAVMGGVDAVVFTGGIGENSASMRRRILQRLEFLGLNLDDDRNADASVSQDDDHALITTERSRVEALVVKTNEELMIAQETARLLRARASAPVTLTIPIAISARHAHLTEDTFKALFGKDARPTHYKDLSQPGQFACEEKINLLGPRNRIDGVRILGPLRGVNQIEIARSDEFLLGVDAPVRDSGQTTGSAPIAIEGPCGTVHLSEGLICARRHIHMQPADAVRLGVTDRQDVAVTVSGGPRDLTFGGVLVRVSENYRLEMHIDTDEGNAAELPRQAAGDLVYTDIDDACARLGN